MDIGFRKKESFEFGELDKIRLFKNLKNILYVSFYFRVMLSF